MKYLKIEFLNQETICQFSKQLYITPVHVYFATKFRIVSNKIWSI